MPDDGSQDYPTPPPPPPPTPADPSPAECTAHVAALVQWREEVRVFAAEVEAYVAGRASMTGCG